MTVGAEEVILCVDDDCSSNFINSIESHYNSIKKHQEISQLKILKVERRKDYFFHQAWVRRKGFLKAKNDVILTGDIDLYINRCVLNAVYMVGKNNVGLASVRKFEMERNLSRLLLTVWRFLYGLPIWKKNGVFTGLYALYRPYWLETEGDGIKHLKNVKEFGINESILGEDTYLRNSMKKKYHCVYLSCIGAIDYGTPLHDTTNMQFAVGKDYFHQGISFARVLLRSFTLLRPYSIAGYLYEKERIKRRKMK